MVITAEDKRYNICGKVGLDFFSDKPWEGTLQDIVFGDSFSELYGDGKNEGLFYQLYSTETRERIGYGIFDPDSPKEEIEMFQSSQVGTS